MKNYCAYCGNILRENEPLCPQCGKSNLRLQNSSFEEEKEIVLEIHLRAPGLGKMKLGASSGELESRIIQTVQNSQPIGARAIKEEQESTIPENNHVKRIDSPIPPPVRIRYNYHFEKRFFWVLMIIGIIWTSGLLLFFIPDALKQPSEFPTVEEMPLPSSTQSLGWNNSRPLIMFLPDQGRQGLSQSFIFTDGVGPKPGFNGIEIWIYWRSWEILHVISTKFASASDYNLFQYSNTEENKTFNSSDKRINATIYSDTLIPAGLLNCEIQVYNLLFNKTGLEMRIPAYNYTVRASKGLNIAHSSVSAGVSEMGGIIRFIDYYIPQPKSDGLAPSYRNINKTQKSTNWLLSEEELFEEWPYLWAEVYIYNEDIPLVIYIESIETYTEYFSPIYYEMASDNSLSTFSAASETVFPTLWSFLFIGIMGIVLFGSIVKQRKRQQLEYEEKQRTEQANLKKIGEKKPEPIAIQDLIPEKQPKEVVLGDTSPTKSV